MNAHVWKISFEICVAMMCYFVYIKIMSIQCIYSVLPNEGGKVGGEVGGRESGENTQNKGEVIKVGGYR